MDDTKLRTMAHLEEFLAATPGVSFSGVANAATGSDERYAHISRILTRFDYFHLSKRERGVVLAYLQRTSGYRRAQVKRLVVRWHENRLAETPLVKRTRWLGAP